MFFTFKKVIKIIFWYKDINILNISSMDKYIILYKFILCKSNVKICLYLKMLKGLKDLYCVVKLNFQIKSSKSLKMGFLSFRFLNVFKIFLTLLSAQPFNSLRHES